MPVPTTHTDVLIPNPDSETPTPAAVKVTLRGSLSSGAAPFDATEIMENGAYTVRSNQTISGNTPDGDFQVDMEVKASHQSTPLLLVVDPPSSNANAPHAPNAYTWTNVGAIDSLAIRVAGTLRGNPLVARFILGNTTQKQAQLSLEDAAGLAIAFVDVNFL